MSIYLVTDTIFFKKYFQANAKIELKNLTIDGNPIHALKDDKLIIALTLLNNIFCQQPLMSLLTHFIIILH